MKKGRILSGMRPTGRLHLGNWFGALKTWVELQDKYECYFEIADWHALMSDYEDAQKVFQSSLDMLCVWLAVGLDPEKSVMFRQSDVCEHLDLFFIFSALTPLPWLERCPTYKEALENIHEKDIRNYAFLGYPALQAADIALYRADSVPVGKDQLPHLEMTREIVRRFNHVYSTDVMVEPEAVMTRVRKLTGTDGRKMSKSYGNTIYITESSEGLRKKVNSMITDPARIRKTDPGHPEVCTVFGYHGIFSENELSGIEENCRKGSMGCVECKKRLLHKMEELISPVRERYKKLKENPSRVEEILREGNRRASEAAGRNLKMFRKEMKFD